MTQYMLSVHHTEGEPDWSPEEMQAAFEAVDAFNQKAQDAGVWVFAGGLMPRESAVRIDATGPETIVSDGPFAESKEWLGGFWVFELPDLATAQQWAAEGSKACAGAVVVRPFQAE